jgi:hypothetical protein
MPIAQNTQGAPAGTHPAAQTPPIPAMDGAAASPPPSAAAIRQQVRDATRHAVQAASQAAQAAGQVAGQAGTIAPPPFSPRDMIPPQAVDISIALFVAVTACVILGPFARAIARSLDRKSSAAAIAGPDLTPQIRQLQDSVDAMTLELERLSEGQRFTAKLLVDRSSANSGT